jgi:hypothetical protein
LTLLNLLDLKLITYSLLFLTEARLYGMPDSFTVEEFSLGHSRMKSDSFFNKDSRKLRSGKLFIGEVMEYFSGMKGCFVVVPKDVSEKKTEHLMV